MSIFSKAHGGVRRHRIKHGNVDRQVFLRVRVCVCVCVRACFRFSTHHRFSFFAFHRLIYGWQNLLRSIVRRVLLPILFFAFHGLIYWWQHLRRSSVRRSLLQLRWPTHLNKITGILPRPTGRVDFTVSKDDSDSLVLFRRKNSHSLSTRSLFTLS